MAIPSGLGAQLGMVDEQRVNEVQTVATSGTPTGGTFTLVFEGVTSGAIQWNSSAAQLQTILEAMPNIGVGNVACTVGPLPAAITVTFTGGAVKQRNVAQFTLGTNSLTGGATPAPVFGTTTPGLGYGDYVVPTRFLEFASEGVKLNIGRIAARSMRAANQVVRQDRRVANKKGAGGPVDFELMTNGYGLLFKQIFGSAAVVTTPGGATLTRDLTYTLGDPTGKSFGLQLGVPDVGGTARPFSYTGCKVVGATFKQALDALFDLTVNIDAKDEDTTQSLAAVSYPASQQVFHQAQTIVSLGGVNYDVNDVTLNLNRAQKTDRYFLRGDTRKKEPLLNGLADISGSFGSEFNDLAAYARYQNLTTVAVVMTWTGPVIESTFNYSITITLPAVQFDGETPDVSGPDAIMQPLPFTVVNDGTNQPITLVYRTTDTVD